MRREKMEKMLRIIKWNEIACTELVFSIDVSSSSGKIAFGILEICMINDYEDIHAGLSWEKLKKKYDPVSSPSLSRTKRLFREEVRER
jgi:hypothetical protein